MRELTELLRLTVTLDVFKSLKTVSFIQKQNGLTVTLDVFK